MRALRRFVTRLVGSITRRRNEKRLRDEIEEHLAQQTAENIQAGMAPEEARRQAVAPAVAPHHTPRAIHVDRFPSSIVAEIAGHWRDR